MFKLTVRFLIDVFDLGEQLWSRPVGRRSDVGKCSQRRIWEHASDWLNSFVTEEKKQKRG